MNITRVKGEKGKKGALLTCTVVLDDCLMLTGLNLFKGEKGYFLVFPSRQDVYKSISELNEGVSINYPTKVNGFNEHGKCYDEFFHPVKSEFYFDLLHKVVDMYENKKWQGA